MIRKLSYLYKQQPAFFEWGLLTVLLFWMLVGAFPLVNIEGDSALYSAGCERLYQRGFILPPDYMYGWDMQPLVAVFVVAFRYLLPFLTCEQIYCLLTVAATILFLLISSRFIAKLSNHRASLVCLLFFLFPESYSIAFYPNTAIFAAATAMAAFYGLMRNPLNPWALCLLGVAPLFRVDVLMVYPLVLFLLWRNNTFLRSFLYSMLYAVITVVVLFVGCWILKANPLYTFFSLSDLNEHNALFINGWESFAKIHLSYYTLLSLFVMGIGIWQLYKKRDWKYLGLLLFPIVITYLIYFPFRGCATKHLLYMLPSCVMLAVAAWPYVYNKLKAKSVPMIVVLVILAMQSVLAFSVAPKSQPWIVKDYATQKPVPQLPVFQLNLKGNICTVGLGAGQIIPTADELMLLSGHAVVPFYWHHVKSDQLKSNRALSLVLERHPKDTARIITTQASDWKFSQYLHSMGYEMKEKGLFVHKTLPTIRTIYCNLERNVASFEQSYLMEPNIDYIYYDWDWQIYYINECLTTAVPLTKHFAQIKAIHE